MNIFEDLIEQNITTRLLRPSTEGLAMTVLSAWDYNEIASVA